MTKVVFMHVNKTGVFKTPYNTLVEAQAKVNELGGSVKVTYVNMPEESHISKGRLAHRI